MDLTNASAIVAGRAGGFGSATLRRLAEKGAEAFTTRPVAADRCLANAPRDPGIPSRAALRGTARARTGTVGR